MASWLDTVLNHFLNTVDDEFRYFSSNASYILTDSFLQLGHSLWIILDGLFFFLVTGHQFSLKVIAQKWHAPIKWFLFLVVLSGLWGELYHAYQHLMKNCYLSRLKQIIECWDFEFRYGPIFIDHTVLSKKKIHYLNFFNSFIGTQNYNS